MGRSELLELELAMARVAELLHWSPFGSGGNTPTFRGSLQGS
jgi:hypothetical protein